MTRLKRWQIPKPPKALSSGTARLQVYETASDDPSQRWAWRLRASNGRSIAVSGEGYTDRQRAVVMGLSVCGGRYSVTAVEISKSDGG